MLDGQGRTARLADERHLFARAASSNIAVDSSWTEGRRVVVDAVMAPGSRSREVDYCLLAWPTRAYKGSAISSPTPTPRRPSSHLPHHRPTPKNPRPGHPPREPGHPLREPGHPPRPPDVSASRPRTAPTPARRAPRANQDSR